MGNLNETEKWEENIYQLETSDPVLGGADGISNRAPRQLANRTKWLKKKTEEVAQSLAEHARSRNHPDATLTEKGFTQLSSATNSTSETLAATPKAVKAAYDLAAGKAPASHTHPWNQITGVPSASLTAKG
ncbi:phage tail protein, partial [Escherichia coli]|nr:phage tail protein [Escherichia coli]